MTHRIHAWAVAALAALITGCASLPPLDGRTASSALDAYPNIDVRLYDPVVQRDARALNFLTDFTRANHRMHNKSFTADNLKARFTTTRADPESAVYLEAVRVTPLVQDLLDRKIALEWTTATLLHDDPAKTLDTTARTDALLFPALVQTIGRPEKTLDLVSPYFVPGAEGTANLVELARSGVKVRILTNSLAATDESAVHASSSARSTSTRGRHC